MHLSALLFQLYSVGLKVIKSLSFIQIIYSQFLHNLNAHKIGKTENSIYNLCCCNVLSQLWGPALTQISPQSINLGIMKVVSF